MYMQPLSGLGNVSVGVQVGAQGDQEVGLVVRVGLRIASMTSNLPRSCSAM